MISYIRGEVLFCTDSSVVVDVGSVGMEVNVTAQTLAAMERTSGTVEFYTYLHVKEDALTLFGFASRKELKLFRMLITVSGIGPKGAVGILSTMSVSDLQMAILTEDAATIAKAPGIGKKTAAKLVLELKDKVDFAETIESRLNAGAMAAAAAGGNTAAAEAIEALVALGYSRTDAAKAVAAVPDGDTMDADDLLTHSLRFM